MQPFKDDNRKSAARAGLAIRQILLQLTIEEGASRGLEHIALRQIAKAASISTTVIFQNFEGKADLIAAAAELAAELDARFHDELREQCFGLVSGRLGLADFIASYIELRSGRSEATYLANLLIHSREHAQCARTLQDWHQARMAFWQDLANRQPVPSGLGAIIGSYVVMEEFYAHALKHHPQYRLLMLETCRALCNVAPRPAESTARLLGTVPFAIHHPDRNGTGQPVAEQLLQAAVAIINEAGVHALNQRDLAARAGVSGSLIAYHYKDMRNLTTQAVWHALVQGIPVQLDPEGDAAAFPATLSEWFATLETMLQVGSDQPQGFYIGLSRLSSEACLLAGRNPEMVPLISYLRGLEGWGTYRVSQSLPALADQIGRDQAAAFAVWIKSQAILRIAGLIEANPAGAEITNAAALVLTPTTGKTQ